MNQFLIRFVQQHPAFRRAELDSCAILNGSTVKLPLNIIEYNDLNPFAIIELPDAAAATALVKRSILTQYGSYQKASH